MPIIKFAWVSQVLVLQVSFSLTHPTLKKMHDTAWKLVGDYVAETAPSWDISIPKSAQGQGHDKDSSFGFSCLHSILCAGLASPN